MSERPGIIGGVPTTRTLTQRELNRALLARQLLLDHADLPIPEVLEQIGGVQAQYAPSMYVGLWSRVSGFTRDDLTKLLAERVVVQGTLLRTTIHLVSAGDFWPWAVAIRDARRDSYVRTTRAAPAEIASASERVRTALSAGPLRQAEIDVLVGAGLRTGVGLWLDLVRIPPSGTWERRRADLYELAERWLGAPPEVTVDEGVETLVRRYLTGFGPATRAEMANWAGLPVATVASVLKRLDLVRYRSENGAELVDLPGLPLPSADVQPPLRFLPTWDATLLAHARRTQILPEAYRSRIFTSRNPHSVGTFLVDGSVAGTWRYDGRDVQIAEFAPLSRVTRREVVAEAERLAEFHR